MTGVDQDRLTDLLSAAVTAQLAGDARLVMASVDDLLGAVFEHAAEHGPARTLQLLAATAVGQMVNTVRGAALLADIEHGRADRQHPTRNAAPLWEQIRGMHVAMDQDRRDRDPDGAQRAENIQAAVDSMVHDLVGCQWGHAVGHVEEEREPCDQQAVQIVVVHAPDGEHIPLKLCAEHRDRVLELTDPSQRHVEGE